MDIQEYINKMKLIQDNLLIFLDYECNEEENFSNFVHSIEDQKILTNKMDFKLILYLINRISIDHHRSANFMNKIEQILKKYKSQIQKYYSNIDLFKIFKKSKRLLLYLFEDNIIKFDQNIFKTITTQKYKNKQYIEYFSPEIKKFIEEELKNEKRKYSQIIETVDSILNEYDQNFNELRKIGENHQLLYRIIQNDSIDEFITFVNKENYPLKSLIEPSIFETNSFLLNNTHRKTLIEYAAFFGSVQIFKYLYKNGIKLKPSLFIYGIHGENEEIIHILEDENIIKDAEYEYENENENESESEYDDYDGYQYEDDFKYEITYKGFVESIKCNHNQFANYIQENYLNGLKFDDKHDLYCFKYYNFTYFPIDIDIQKMFYFACQYDYFTIVQLLLKTTKIDINAKYIQKNNNI